MTPNDVDALVQAEAELAEAEAMMTATEGWDAVPQEAVSEFVNGGHK